LNEEVMKWKRMVVPMKLRSPEEKENRRRRSAARDRVPVMILTFMMDTTRVKEGCMNINTTIVKRTLQLKLDILIK